MHPNLFLSMRSLPRRLVVGEASSLFRSVLANVRRRTSTSKFILAYDQCNVLEQRFAGTVSSWSSLKAAVYGCKTEPVVLPPIELVVGRNIQQAQQSSDDFQSKVSSKLTEDLWISLSVMTDTSSKAAGL